MKPLLALAACILTPLVSGQGDPASPLHSPKPSPPPAASEAGPGTAPGASAGVELLLPADILMADKQLAMSDPQALLQAFSAEGALDGSLPHHLAVVRRFNGDMQWLSTLLLWVENKEEADRLAAPAALLCRRGAEWVMHFETEVAPHLTEQQQRELSREVTPEQKQVLAEVFQTLMSMMQTGFFGSAELRTATAPLLKSMLGVPPAS